MKIKANGITINYELDGAEGAPCIAFSNSLATNVHMWDDQAAELKRSFRVLRYDQRGHGGTDAPAGRYTFETLIADALGLMDALGIKRAHFAGLSMGGATALGFAQQHSDRLDRVIVCDSPCMSTPQSTQQWEERIAILEKSKSIDPLVEPTIERWFPAEIRAAKAPQERDTECLAIQVAGEIDQVHFQLPGVLAEGGVRPNVRGSRERPAVIVHAYGIDAVPGQQRRHLFEVRRRETERPAALLAGADDTAQVIRSAHQSRRLDYVARQERRAHTAARHRRPVQF